MVYLRISSQKREPQFTFWVWRAFCHQLNINTSLTSGYHPQSNGQVKRLNQKAGRFLHSYCYMFQDQWNNFLLWTEYIQNTLIHSSTSLTPIECVLAYWHPLFPWTGEPSDVPEVDTWSWHSEEVWDAAHVRLQQAIQCQRIKGFLPKIASLASPARS